MPFTTAWTGLIDIAKLAAKDTVNLQAGAAHLIAAEEKGVEEEIKRLTDGKGARVVFDAVRGPSFAKLVSSTSMDGLVLTYGVLSKEMNSFPSGSGPIALKTWM